MISIKTLMKIYRNRCFHCGIFVKTDVHEGSHVRATRDHLIPKARGGSDHQSNIVLSCRKCNGQKGDTYTGTNPRTVLKRPRKRRRAKGLYIMSTCGIKHYPFNLEIFELEITLDLISSKSQ